MKLRLVAGVLAVALCAPVASGGDKVEHYDMILAIAYQMTGDLEYSQTIADASWSMDENLDTIAHDSEWVLIKSAARYVAGRGGKGAVGFEGIDALLGDRPELEKQLYEGHFRYITQGFLHHALGSNDSRDRFRRLFTRYAETVVRERPLDETLKRMLLGMYLHSVVDSHIHPKNPVLGHAPFHDVDIMAAKKAGYLRAAEEVAAVLRQGLPPAIPARSGLAPLDREFLPTLIETLARTYGRPDKAGRYHIHYDDDTMRQALGSFHSGWLRIAKEVPARPNFRKIEFKESADRKRFGITASRYTQNIPTFIDFVRTSGDSDAHELRRELLRHMDRTLLRLKDQVVKGVIKNGTEEVLFQWLLDTLPDDDPYVPPPSSPPSPSDSGREMRITVTGAGSPVERALPISSGRKIPERDFAPRIIVEVQQRGWSTEGLEKYMNPVKPRPQDKVVHAPSDGTDKTMHRRVIEALQQTEAALGVHVVIVAPQRDPLPDVQHKVVAEITGLASSSGPRSLTLHGPAAAALPAIVARDIQEGKRGFEQTTVVSPLGPPAAVPADAVVVIHRDSRFHNFDPGSPGYEKMTQHAKWFAKKNDVFVAPSSHTANDSFTQKAEMGYMARGTDTPVRLTNVSLRDAGGRTRQDLREVDRRNKPSNVGGISLVTPAQLPLDPGRLRGARFDAPSGRIVLKAADGQEWKLPALDSELARIAYESAYRIRNAPELSIGANPGDDIEPGRPGRSLVYYLGGAENTIAGLIMLRADELLGDMAFGGSEVWERLKLRHLNLHTLAEMYPDAYAENPKPVTGGAERVYLLPDRIRLAETLRGELDFVEFSFSVRFSPCGPAEDEFASAVQQCWRDILASPGAAAFRDLVQLARATSIFIWLKENRIPFDDSLARAEIRRVFTPRDVASRKTPTRADLRPTLPLTVYDADGINRIIDRAGRATRIVHERQLLRRVERRDGARLDVHYDGLGQPCAVSIAGACGAAFHRDAKSGQVHFVDGVLLKYDGGVYAGFDSTGASRVLYNVSPEAAVASIVDGFIAEGESR